MGTVAMDEANFVNEVLSGNVLEPSEEIHDWIDRWHTDKTLHTIPLHEYLGFSWEEYQRWSKEPSLLRCIFAARHAGMPLDEYIEKSQKVDPKANRELLEWLQAKCHFVGVKL